MRRVAWCLATAAVLAVLLAGCGGGGDDFIGFGTRDESLTTGDRQLPDGSRIDFRTFRAPVAGTIFIAMRGIGLNPVEDPFIWVFPGRVDTVNEAVDLINDNDFISDDDSGLGLDAQLLVNVAAGEVFTVGFNSFDENDLGSYRWIVDYAQNVVSAAAPADAGDKPNDATKAKAKAQ